MIGAMERVSFSMPRQFVIIRWQPFEPLEASPIY
jgi:hypothetical protein